MRDRCWVLGIGYFGIVFGLNGCSTRPPEIARAAEPPWVVEPKQTKPERVTDRPGNKMGRVYIAMYHHIRPGRGQMFRTPAQFRADLEQYYKLGFRPVLASEYIANKMPLPPGASPIVMTFDDSNPSQIQLTKGGAVTPNCAIGIWMDFAKDHPDFPVHGTFFALPNSMWGHHAEAAKKLKILTELGSEVGNHTMNHYFLHRLSDKRVKYELATCSDRLEAMGVKGPHVMAVPYGDMPRHQAILKGFPWKGKRMTFAGVFKAWGPPAPSPEDPKFDKYRIPRMVATSGEDTIQSYLAMMKKGKYPPYVQP